MGAQSREHVAAHAGRERLADTHRVAGVDVEQAEDRACGGAVGQVGTADFDTGDFDTGDFNTVWGHGSLAG